MARLSPGCWPQNGARCEIFPATALFSKTSWHPSPGGVGTNVGKWRSAKRPNFSASCEKLFFTTRFFPFWCQLRWRNVPTMFQIGPTSATFVSKMKVFEGYADGTLIAPICSMGGSRRLVFSPKQKKPQAKGERKSTDDVNSF